MNERTDDRDEAADGSDGSADSRDGNADGIESTVCPFCAVGCTLAPGETPRGGARGVAGPVNREGSLCPKGIGAFDALADDDRLTTPLVRRDGDLVATSWEEALARAADELAGVREAHGADALCFLGAPHCSNEENYLLGKLARTLGTNNVDNRARICHASAMTAVERRLGWPAMTNSLADLETADVFLVVGANPAAQQPVAFDSSVRPAVDAGATLVHVDPRRNRTTEKADVHLAPRPGTDPLVVTLLCALVREFGLVDGTFVAERTDGYTEYARRLAAMDVEGGATRAGVDADALRDVARRVGEADRVAVVAAAGIEEGDHRETDTADALLNLLLLTGNLGRPGTGMNVFRGLNNEQGAVDAGCRPDRLPGHQPVDDDAARARVAEEWGVDPPATPGLDERQAIEGFGDRIRGALVVGENPAVGKRDEAWLDDRFSSLSALVAVDLFESETTAYADVVLPAASGLEKAGTVTNLDRRVQRLRPVTDPPGRARPDFAILRSLGRRLVGEAFEYADPQAVFEEWTRVSPLHDGMTLEAVTDGGVQWPVRTDGRSEPEGTAILYEDAFETPDGRAPFVTVDIDVPDASASDLDLDLVVGSRAGGFAAEGPHDDRVHLHEADARERGIEDGDPVVVRNGAGEVTTTARVGGRVREGTAYLHADAAEPLTAGEGSTVEVRRAAASDGPAATEESDE